MKIIPSITLMIYSAIAGLIIGVGVSAWGASAWYGPKLDLAKLQAKTLGGKIEAQNKAIDKLSEATKVQAEKLKAAQAAAKKRSGTRQQKALAILATPLPAGKEQCAAASDLIRLELSK